jgi:hypothetical protein
MIGVNYGRGVTLNNSESNTNGNNHFQKITAVKLLKDSYAYGLNNFYKVGIFWWFFIALDVFVTAFCAKWLNELTEPNTYNFLLENLVFFITFLITLPAYFIGITYYNHGKFELKNIQSALLRLFYALECSALMVVLLIPGMFFVFFSSSTSNALLALIGFLIGTLIIIYIACRAFTIIFIPLDKGLGPKKALTQSLEMTSGHFIPIFSLFILTGLITILPSLLNLRILDLATYPITYLALIYAYKRLDFYHTQGRPKGQGENRGVPDR